MASVRFAALLGAISVAVIAVTYLLYRVFQKQRVVKYLPSLLLLPPGIYYVIMMKAAYTGFEDIARIIMAIMFLTGFLSGMVSALFLDFAVPKLRRKDR